MFLLRWRVPRVSVLKHYEDFPLLSFGSCCLLLCTRTGRSIRPRDRSAGSEKARRLARQEVRFYDALGSVQPVGNCRELVDLFGGCRLVPPTKRNKLRRLRKEIRRSS